MCDPLTGLPDRTLLQEHLRVAAERAKRTGERIAMIFVDLDDTRRVNDALGFHQGDAYLRAVATRLQENTRASDVLARIHGDGFGLLATEIGEYSHSFRIVQRLLSALAEPVVIDGHEVFATACVGIAVLPDDSASPEELLRHADAALRHAKEQGRGRVSTFASEMVAGALERLDLEAELRHALAGGELLLHYQPQVALAGGRIVGVEALARWMHPTRGMISPGVFIPIAEESGFIEEFGAWALRTACTTAAERIPDECQVAVNVASPQFSSASFTDIVRQALCESGLAPWRLELEITESVLLRNLGLVANRLAELRALGIHVSIDDFGTGYSSIAYLRQLPVSRLKIDRSFVSSINLGGDREDTTDLVHAMVHLGHSLGMEVVAEGIETAAQARHLAHVRCDRAQGFLFGRPVAVELLDYTPRSIADND